MHIYRAGGLLTHKFIQPLVRRWLSDVLISFFFVQVRSRWRCASVETSFLSRFRGEERKLERGSSGEDNDEHEILDCGHV